MKQKKQAIHYNLYH